MTTTTNLVAIATDRTGANQVSVTQDETHPWRYALRASGLQGAAVAHLDDEHLRALAVAILAHLDDDQATATPAALGHACIHQTTPGAPTCGNPATLDLTTGATVRAYCDDHIPTRATQ